MNKSPKNKIIIFRFDRKFKICQNRLKLIQKLNPNIPIHGIYGGQEKEFRKAKKILGKYFTTLFCITHKSVDWKWRNFDFVLQDWYKKIGKKINFETAYTIEWDLLLTDSIENLYSDVQTDELAMSGLVPLSKISKAWFWTVWEPYKTQWIKLLKIAQKKFKYNKKPFGAVCPGLCFPKSFLEKYSKIKIPELVHDELRIPLFAQIFGYKIKDTGFCKEWFNIKEDVYFNTVGFERLFIKPEIINSELKKSNGRKAFHPYRNPNLPSGLKSDLSKN